MDFQSILIVAASIIGLFIFIGLIMARLYRRSTREVSLVKTGSGGRKVIMDGGTIAIPFLHEISYVNMKTLRLEVHRKDDASLITRDRMRVDVGVEFYVSVNATEDGISRAAQTLGDRTFNVDQLREMIEGKLVDGLRSVAARMSMDELHENRSEFVQEVQNAISEDLLKNGLELESVSLTALDQTSFEALDENNAFNAVGMRKLAEVIATSKKERATITAEADVAVRQAEMEAERQKYEIERAQQEAQIAQIRQIEILQAEQEAEIARNREISDQAKEKARIEKEREIRAAEIERERVIREAEIANERELEVADQDRQIIVAQKSEEESRARASADSARAEAKKAQEAIETARAVAEADRAKQIALIEATKEAERQATAVRLSAEAEKDAAADRAAALTEEAQADANALTIRAEAKKADMLAEAEGRHAIAGAENALSAEIIKMKLDIARLEALPGIVAEMVKPAEKIDSIKIHQVGGLNGAGAGANGGGQPVNQALDSIMGMALQMPAMKKLGEELGLSLENGLADVTGDAFPTPEAPEDSAADGEVITPAKPKGSKSAK
ncbi:flotillin domain-containing protein [Yoonia sp. BS5-3]|uniref:Flotillin family protein n=1 Tax=Yoonia phaeophyticola TaxID=3137369 RepID=A0ABZ2V1Q6_9RHOB